MSPIERARQLREIHRHEEAESVLIQFLGQDAENAVGLAELALTRLEMPGRRKDALTSVDAAIAADPDNSFIHSAKSLILHKLERDKDALAAAERAIALDPEYALPWVAKGSALAGQRQWLAAEAAMRHALEIDPDDGNAQNLLAICLRAQGKVAESEAEVMRRLSHDPEDARTHANAGWATLQRGNHAKAEDHFSEALRLDPEMEYARSGLRESFKSRSWFYRLYLKWVFFLQKYSGKQQVVILIGMYLGYVAGRELLQAVHPIAAAVLVVVYLFLVFGGFLASGIGSFLLLKDPLARLTLNREERWEGAVVGGGFFFGVVLIALGILVGPLALSSAGLALMLAGIPGSMAFTNPSRVGRVVFLCICGLLYAVAILNVQALYTGGDLPAKWIQNVTGTAYLSAIFSTWLTLFPKLHNRAAE